METNNIKSFAKEARIILMDGIMQRLKYWGFSEDGSNDQQLESTQGGYIFRGQIYTDTTVPAKWNKLKKLLTDQQAVQDIIEATAYTWFNRLMAIKILEANGYIQEQIAYTDGMRTPMIVQNAKRGENELNSKGDRDLLLEYLQDDKEEQAFGVLITSLCNRNKVLHDVFGRIDDYTEILLPQNLLQTDGLLDLINSDAIAIEDYKEVELIGWLYQFYIADKKDEVFKGFKKNIKARAEDIPAATQIFTPKWIVKYMVENTVGKIYLDYEPTSSLKADLKYLVENESDKQGVSIIKDITELTLIDPACGSGHILVTGFELLFKIYREEGYTAKQAVENILIHNLYGLDIDDRAMQLARFAVLLKAAEYDAGILDKGLMPHIYSFPEAEHFVSEELQSFLGHDNHAFTAELKEAVTLLNQGKNIGSALKVELSQEAHAAVLAQFKVWLQKEKNLQLGIDELGIWMRLKPIIEVLLVLTKQYVSVAANPPYMGQKNMNSALKDYTIINYPNSKSDLYTVFIEKTLSLLTNMGKLGLINPPSWMFTSSFSSLRTELLEHNTIDSLLNLGRGVFGVDFGSTAYIIKKKKSDGDKGVYRNLFRTKVTVDSPEQKEKWFLKSDFNRFERNQENFLKIKNAPLAFWLTESIFTLFETTKKIDEFVEVKQGLATGENNLFRRNWSEISFKNTSVSGYNDDKKWFPYNSGGQYRKWFGNHDYVVNWSNNGNEIRNFKNDKGKLRSRPQNISFYFEESGSWSKMTASGLALRYYPAGFIFDVSGCSFFGKNSDLKYIIGLLNSHLKIPFIDAINQSFNYEVGQISSVPIKMNDKYDSVVSLVKNCIQICERDWNSYEYSWGFKQSPLLNAKDSLISAYENWKDQVTLFFFELHSNEEELNQIFIGIYGLQDELIPDVALKNITVLQDELDKKDIEGLENTFREKGKEAIELPIKKEEVLSQFISYCIGVFLGRYRLDKPGLNIAHPKPSDEELKNYTHNGHKIEIDDDGILPLMGEDCAFPDDALVRTKDLLLAIWGEKTLTENINFLHECLGINLHKWLTEKFWSYHTSMYKKKPIYWLFTSNPKKPQNAAFKVLVYMHRMDKYSVQKIQRNYLHPHQEHIKRELEKLRENEENLNKEELKQLEQLQNWELECRDYNEVLKELANQQIEFDLDDGVTVNYEKFEGAVAII